MFAKTIPRQQRQMITLIFFAALLLYVTLRLFGFHQLFNGDAEGLGSIIQVIGTVYSVLLAFAVYVIWEQFNTVEHHVLEEVSMLDDVARFGSEFKGGTEGDPWGRIKPALENYIKSVVKSEWPALAKSKRDDRTERYFSEVLKTVMSVTPSDDRERSIYDRLLEIIEQVSSHRDERLSISTTRIPRTLLNLVNLLAAVILVMVFLYPFASAFLGVFSFTTLGIVMLFAYFVVMDMDNPFQGAWNINPRPFEELLKKL